MMVVTGLLQRESVSIRSVHKRCGSLPNDIYRMYVAMVNMQDMHVGTKCLPLLMQCEKRHMSVASDP